MPCGGFRPHYNIRVCSYSIVVDEPWCGVHNESIKLEDRGTAEGDPGKAGGLANPGKDWKNWTEAQVQTDCGWPVVLFFLRDLTAQSE